MSWTEALKKQMDEEIFKEIDNHILNEKLENKKEDLKQEIELIEQTILTDIFARAMASKNEDIRLVGEAFGHAKLKIQPSTEKLGHVLAKRSHRDYDLMLYKDQIYKDMLEHGFDIFNYICDTTHYNCCDNGHYSRS